MALQWKSISTPALRLLAVLVLLGWPRIGSAAGTWSVLSLPQQSDAVVSPIALASDAVGNLYVAGKDASARGQIQKRDTQGTGLPWRQREMLPARLTSRLASP